MITYNYCPQCGEKVNKDNENLKCLSCNLTFYKNSKPTAGILPIKDGQVLLSRRGIEPYKGQIDIIGGFLNNGEDPLDGVRREASEETGLDVEPKEILDIVIDKYGDEGEYTLNIFYIGEIKGGEQRSMDDVASLEWVPVDTLPISGGFPNTSKVLSKLKDWYQSQKK